MIKQHSIDEVRFKSDVEEVISQFVQVKKHTACCPFHNEKTASFRINVKKQFYKCFGCGVSGDVFQFVMKHERKTFIESVEWVANYYNLTLEYDQQLQQEAEDTKSRRAEMLSIVDYAHQKYTALLQGLPADAPAIQYLAQRGYDKARRDAWGLGFAPDDWRFITPGIINMGKYQAARDCGLVQTKNESNYDFYRNRITVPIHDHNGVLVGIAGRIVPGEDSDKQAKYMNPMESLIYNKKKVWYGLWQAQRAIKEAGFAYIVEGYFDVQSMHDAELLNTVSPCGTEADVLQLKFLKRYSDCLVFGYDADKGGQPKMMKQIDLALQLDFKVQVLDLPVGMDPDEFIRSHVNAVV